MEDILGIGQWQAARVNERSEVMNELSKPFIGYKARVVKGKVVEETYTAEASLLTVFGIVALYYGYEALKTLVPALVSAMSQSGNGPGEGNTFTSTVLPATAAAVSPAATPLAIYSVASPEAKGVLDELARQKSPFHGAILEYFKSKGWL